MTGDFIKRRFVSQLVNGVEGINIVDMPTILQLYSNYSNKTANKNSYLVYVII